jgi:hypothetical protein
MKKFGKFTHKWEFDLPWHMVDLRKWFYMVNVGFIEPIVFLHVRVAGIRSLWEFVIEPDRDAQQSVQRTGLMLLPSHMIMSKSRRWAHGRDCRMRVAHQIIFSTGFDGWRTCGKANPPRR